MAYCLNQVRVGYLSEERADLPVFRQCLQALLESPDANEFPCKVVKGSRIPVAFRVSLAEYAEVACWIFVVRGRASERNRCTGVSDFLRVNVFVDFSFPFKFLLEDSDHFRLSLSVLTNAEFAISKVPSVLPVSTITISSTFPARDSRHLGSIRSSFFTISTADSM